MTNGSDPFDETSQVLSVSSFSFCFLFFSSVGSPLRLCRRRWPHLLNVFLFKRIEEEEEKTFLSPPQQLLHTHTLKGSLFFFFFLFVCVCLFPHSTHARQKETNIGPRKFIIIIKPFLLLLFFSFSYSST